MNVKDNIYLYLNTKDISPTKAERELGWSVGALTKANSITSDRLKEFILFYTDLSAEWLLRGEGEMLKTNTPQDSLDTLLPLLDQRDKRIRDLEIENTLLKAKLGINEERDKLKKDTEVA